MPGRGGQPLFEMPLKMALISKAQLLRHVGDALAALEQAFGAVDALIQLIGVRGLPISVFKAVSWSSFFEHPDRESAAQACTDAGLSWHCLSNSAGLILPSAEFRRFWL